VTIAGLVAAALGVAQGPFVSRARAEPSEPATAEALAARRPLPVPSWSTLTTPHFRIHHYTGEEELAERAAVRGERAYQQLSDYLGWELGGRVDLTLSDQTDSANGFASAAPSNHIVAYAVPPQLLSTLSDYDDWLDLLVTHELTHVFHLDTILGLPRLLDRVFGKLIAPNGAQPSWFIEGLAVLLESRFTSAGRVRSSFYDMYLRTAALEGRLLDLANASNGPTLFPYGEAAYLYGSAFLKYLEDRYGPVKLREMSLRYGTKLIPLSLARTARETFGRSFDELYADWQAELVRRAEATRDEVDRAGRREGRRLTFNGETTGDALLGARFWGDSQHVVFLRSTSFQHPGYVRLDLASGQQEEVLARHGLGPMSPSPDGTLVLARTAYTRLPRRILGASHADWEDIFHFDPRTGRLEALTLGHRAHDPDVSPDGATIACSVGGHGRQELALLPREGGAPRVVRARRDGDLAAAPAWSPDGQALAFVRVDASGAKDIHLLQVATGEERALTHDRAADLSPRFSPDGRWVVFSSDRTGISNVFAYELATERLVQLTNVVGGAFQPALSPDGQTLIYAGFTSFGYDLYALPFAPDLAPLASPPTRMEPAALNGRPEPRSLPDTPEAAKVPVTRGPYRGWLYLYPKSWEPPTISSNDLGLGTALTLSLAAADPAALHNLAVTVSVPTSLDTSALVAYAYNRFWPSLNIAVARAALSAHDLVIDGQQQTYRQHTRSLSASVGLPLHRTADDSADLSFYYRYADTSAADPFPTPTPFQGILRPPEMGPLATGGFELAYSNARAWNLSVSAQEGRSLSFGLAWRAPLLGSRYHGAEAHWSWTEYFTPPWSNLHALALLYAGGASTGDKSATYGLGGFPREDVVRAFFLQQRVCCLFLRGYPAGSFVGDRYHLFSAEYRAPLLFFDRGSSTFPLFVRRLHGAVFADAGRAFSGDLAFGDLKTGIGAELRLDVRFFYALNGLVQIGLAKGLATEGVVDYYWVTSVPF